MRENETFPNGSIQRMNRWNHNEKEMDEDEQLIRGQLWNTFKTIII